ncbi:MULTISPECIES: ATP-dependent zinc metalloprotease FtsH [Veillonella]|uniref:ATP-dependent zinc metalloprotease FtsH n=1 Tax=Veillonella TaxID=29465 RepID=UPI0001EB45A8|nr:MULTISPECIES: ATP-dependent zinc metalloprotease FtsH [Veillonella]EFR59236.1 ATP-dependent metallopeptidase HflB [Veillonella sp. oral taxon 158 str. F0412]MBS6449187.1 ATP-dependent zinc metalloprotease FtsH [Veillonella sp. oral taxon 158]MDU1129849.1 ATP-dependent zinc metalloprotease FtsH [Veillonella sp.]MDU2868743.1 ATP-dependent zinc metalloprotease FtsH [Veillonella sp.]MDU3564216.1 ATP-dependent zinc metalloprotease FtsH [Veillonella sp.]
MGRFTKNIVLYLLIIAAFVIAIDAFSGQSANKSELSYTGFIQQVQQKKVESVTITNDHGIKGKLKNGTEFNSYAPSDETLIKTLQDNGVEITAAPPEQPAWWMSLLGSAIPIIILVVLFFFIMQQTQGGGGRVMNFGKSRAKLMGEGNVKVSFKDVAGAEEAKQELEEVVEFLKDPGKFTTIGAKIPKGVLLAGPPGTGKTLLAKAVAGEAGVPFFTISGSDFVEMFVGVGASRVRDLFTQAKKNAPCIIFIDEIDAVGRQRGAGLGGGHDEREQTLNQLLVEMDGFGANEGIITIAATNRPDILDPALLRPGRFDRQVIVGRPDLRGREAILKVHARNKPLADDVDLKTIAKKTPGFTGADLNNLLNEAALLAARLNKKVITMAEVEEASEKVSMGPERRSHIVSEKDRKLTAYHESGHAIVAHLLPHADPVHKVTIIPRGAAGGYTMMLPTEEQNYKTKSQLLADIRVALGGRIAEALILDEISTGASGDLQSVTNTARAMVTRWGMSDELGPIVFGEQQEQVFLGKNLGHERNYSEEIAAKIDSEIHRIVEEAYKDVTKLLSENEKFLHDMANALLEEETIDSKAVDNLYKYGTTKAPEVEEPKEALEAAGIVVPEVVEAKENTATVDAPSETPSNEIK